MPEQHCQIKQNKSAIPLSLDHVERSRWRRGLAAAQNVPSSAFRLASVIEDLMNKNTGEAFAGQVELAALSAVSERQVREHLEALADTGWINILSGKERTRPKSKRGLHYRPTWPDEATRTRCMDRKYGSDLPSVKSGGKPPVSDGFKTGDITSLNRQSTVSKPAENRRSHSNDLYNDQESGSAQAEAALTTGSYQSNLEGETHSDRSLRLRASRPEDEADHFAGPSDYSELICSIEGHKPERDESERETPPIPERTDEPQIGDDLDIGEGASITIGDPSISGTGTPRDPDALAGSQREKESQAIKRVAEWLKEQNAIDACWLEYLLSQAVRKSPQRVASQHGCRVAAELGIDDRTASDTLAELLSQAIATDGFDFLTADPDEWLDDYEPQPLDTEISF